MLQARCLCTATLKTPAHDPPRTQVESKLQEELPVGRLLVTYTRKVARSGVLRIELLASLVVPVSWAPAGQPLYVYRKQ